MTERIVLCMKWGSKYGPEYVNRLYRMVHKHLSGPWRMVCLTDDPQGIRPQVHCQPIPSLQLPSGIPERGWTKLTTFASPKALQGLRGNALFFDLDVVITDSLDDFFTLPGSFRIIHDYPRPWRPQRMTGNSSVYRFELGAHPDVLQEFRANIGSIRQRFRNEQAYLSDYMHRHGLLQYWPDGWCPSFKYHCIPTWPTNYWRAPTIPKGAKVVVFHGECNPHDALAGRRNRRFRYVRPSLWVQSCWDAA